MIIYAENRNIVVESYKVRFEKAGETLVQFTSQDLLQWLKSSSQHDLYTVEAILIGETDDQDKLLSEIRSTLSVPVIALLDNRSLQQTISFYQSGVDDVVAKPVHCQELLIRIATIKKRTMHREKNISPDTIEIFFDGRDPEIAGEVIELPRRERRILEYLASINGRRASKSQIFGAIYGVFDENIDECVVESHMSKLRKKLRGFLGFDPIDSKRYLGYRLDTSCVQLGQAAKFDKVAT